MIGYIANFTQWMRFRAAIKIKKRKARHHWHGLDTNDALIMKGLAYLPASQGGKKFGAVF